jgi:glycosyltransferase involved in cell wall biosynthesis
LPAAKAGQKAVSSMGYDEAMSYLPAYEDALQEIIEDVDIVIGHHANLTAIAVADICNRNGKPYVLFLHGTGIEPRHHGHYDDRVWQKIQNAIEGANGIIVTTEYVRDHLVRNMVELPLDRFLIHPCGVDLKEFNSANTGDVVNRYELPVKYVICPGALSLLKGPQNVVEASKYYSDIAETIFIGDGELRGKLETALDGRGRFLGFVSNDDKAKLINAASLLVAAPEKKEHFGIIYTEAMGGSIPVVAYEGGGVNSIVTDKTGILTERNPEALGKAVRSLLTSPEACLAMGLESRKRAEDLYATDHLGPKLEEWLSTFV